MRKDLYRHQDKLFIIKQEIPEDEQKNYPKEDGEGFYEKRFDTDNAKIFDEFVLALSALNDKAKKESNGENEV